MWIASLIRGCFRTSKPASPDATSAAARLRPSSDDEEIPLRYKGIATLSATVRHNTTLLDAKDTSTRYAALSDPLQKALNPASLSVDMPQRPSALLMPDALDIRSPTGGVLRTPLPATPLTLSSPSLPSGSPTLHILRTPMPFGSPVPYPHSIDRTASPDVNKTTATPGAPHGVQPENRGVPCLPYTLPFELRQQGLRASGSLMAPDSKPSTDTVQHSGPHQHPKMPLAVHSHVVQAQLGESDAVTPGPFNFKLSSQGQGRTPRVSGIENPATSYKENRAVIPRHTPFAERVDQAVAKETAFRASLSGRKRSGLARAS